MPCSHVRWVRNRVCTVWRQGCKTARKAAPASVKAPAVSKTRKAAQNDIREFAAIAIGDGVDAAIRMDKTLGAFLETPGAGLAEFRGFVEALALGHFNADALPLMGASKAPGQSCAGMNNFPPVDLWPNVANTAKMLVEIRHRPGTECRVLYACRSQTCNSHICGESASLHMRLNAIGFCCNADTSANWPAVAKAMRASNPAVLWFHSTKMVSRRPRLAS